MPQLSELIERSARRGLGLQGQDGAMPAGRNGPWQDQETPVRTTAHWALLFHSAYVHTKAQEFLDGAVRACDYLIRREHRPGEATFVCRQAKPGKPRCNGLIGQAWAVEPLLVVGDALGNSGYLDVAESVLSLHRYDFRMHGWHVVETDGAELAVQGTFNQQIWFCAMSRLFEKVRGRSPSRRGPEARDFTAWLGRALSLTRSSTFPHHIRRSRGWLPGALARQFPRRPRRSPGSTFSDEELSIGYHSFVLYGLALLKSLLPEGENAWPGRLNRLAVLGVRGATRMVWGIRPGENPFAFGYNPTGIELAYSLVTFPEAATDRAFNRRGPEAWVANQLARHYDRDTGLMDRNAPDPVVLTARLYEAFRLPDMEIPIS